MLFRLALLFTVVPLGELALLVYLGTVIGPWYTILIVVVTGLLGAVLARSEGLAFLGRMRQSVERGAVPSAELFDGALILAGGLLLLTPGVLTDVLGFTLLIPQTRRVVKGWLRGLLERKMRRGDIHFWSAR